MADVSRAGFEASDRRIPPAVWALGFVSLLMDTSSELIHSLLPVFLVTSFGASALTVGLIEGAGEATALIVKVFSGVFSDYWGKRKPLAVLGYGLGAISKPLFALATGTGLVLAARLIDRVGKGIRGAPRDALVADIVPPEMRGAAFGLRQSLDTVGAFLGPLLAMGLMLLWANDFRAVFWVAIVPGSVRGRAVVLWRSRAREEITGTCGQPDPPGKPAQTVWCVLVGCRNRCRVHVGALLRGVSRSCARSRAAYRLLYVPLVLIGMNAVYAPSAYPFGKLSDRMNHGTLLALGVAVLIAADLVLARSAGWLWLATGIGLWGLHMGITQGLLARMVADTAPEDLRGTAYGLFNLMSGLATLLASVVAGLFWDRLGASFAFVAGAVFGAIALMAVVWQRAAAVGLERELD